MMRKLHCGIANKRLFVYAAYWTISLDPFSNPTIKAHLHICDNTTKGLYKLVEMYEKTLMDKAGNKLEQGLCYCDWFGVAESFVFCRKLKF